MTIPLQRILATIALAALAVSAEQAEFEHGGAKLSFEGSKAGTIAVQPSTGVNATLRVKLGELDELDTAGNRIRGVIIAGAAPVFTTGNETIDGQELLATKLEYPLATLLSAPGAACPPATAPATRKLHATTTGYVSFTIYFGLTANVTFPYGMGNNVTVPAGSVKMNFGAVDWPFCGVGNSLRLTLNVHSPRPGGDYPVLLNATDVEASLDNVTEASTGTPAFAADEDSTSAVYTYAEETVVPTRRLMAQGNGGASASSGKPTGDAARPRPEHPKPNEQQKGRMHHGEMKVAQLLVSDALAASFGLQTYAYDAVDGAVRSNVTVGMQGPRTAESGGTVHLLFTFPYFAHSLYYDPSLSFEDAASAGYNVTAVTEYEAVAVAVAARNGVERASSAQPMLQLAAALAAAGILLLV